MSKKAIVVVSFGTTVPETRKKTIEHFGELVQERFPEYDVFHAFTSRIVARRVYENEGIRFLNERTLLYKLAAEGYEDIVLQSLHIIPGAEFSKVLHLAARWEKEGVFKSIKVGRPLLRYIGQGGEYPDDYGKLFSVLASTIPTEEGSGLFLIGHGTVHISQTAYAALQLKASYLGYTNVWLGTIEGFPDWEDVIPRMQAAGVKKLRVKPLFFVAGDHVMNDIFGAEADAVLPTLRASGFDVEPDWQVLGETDEVLQLYIEHIEDAIQDRYTKKRRHQG